MSATECSVFLFCVHYFMFLCKKRKKNKKTKKIKIKTLGNAVQWVKNTTSLSCLQLLITDKTRCAIHFVDEGVVLLKRSFVFFFFLLCSESSNRSNSSKANPF